MRVDRRTFLVGGVGVALTQAGVAPASSGGPAATPDPDRLFLAGRFEAADRGYARVLESDPNNAHATARRGYIALLSNRFAAAERFLTAAVRLAPSDRFSMQLLADCHMRQDQFAKAAPWFRASGNEPMAKQMEAITGIPYEMSGAQSTRIPFQQLDPLPLVEASVNGSAPKRFLIDTGATTVGLSSQTAAELGLEAVSSARGQAGGQTFTINFGILESVRLGDIEVRNTPVHWQDAAMPAPLGDPQPAGGIGTVLFYHFLTTMDYADQALILRRRTREQREGFRAAARQSGAEQLPLWLAADHFPCTLGSVNEHGPRVVSMDTGGSGTAGVNMLEEMARRAGVQMDRERPATFNRNEVYPSVVERASLGRKTARRMHGNVGVTPLPVERVGFETLANFTHAFFKPYAITFDYQDMVLYIL
jgi:predicted aspartyl protease